MPYQLRTLASLIEQRLPRLPQDSPIVKRVGAELTRLHKEAALLAGFVGDPDRSEAFNLRTRNDGAEKLRDRTNVAAADIGKLIQDFRTETRKNRLEKAKLVEGAHSAEIRQVFRGMSSTEKHAFISDALKTGDSAAIACLTTVPPVLVGLTSEQQRDYLSAYLAKFSPDDTDEIDELALIVKTSLQMVEGIAAPTGSVPRFFDRDGAEFKPETTSTSTV